MPAYDVIVVGLGGMGSATVHQLAARGHRVLGLERFGPGHDRGASHGGSRITRQSYFEGPEYVPLLLRAYELWERLAADSGRDVITLTGGVMVGRPESRTVSGALRSARQWGLEHELLDAAELRRRFPTMAPAPDEVALYEAKAGFVRPERTVLAQLDLAERHGADLRFHEPMESWQPDTGGGVRVRTAAGEHTAGQLVITPGPWAPRLLADLGVPVNIERQVQHWFQPRGGVTPFLADRHPVYIWEPAEGSQMYGFPAIDGLDGGAKIAFFRRGSLTTPEDLDTTVHPDEAAEMARGAGGILPDLPGTWLRGEPCLYSTTPDEHFVISRHPGHDAVTVACGFSGHGFKFVPVVGEIVADLATTGTTGHAIGLFDPARFGKASA
ncbi:putative FAD-dependent oxidoreductase [Actinoplanes missouriensis 431]|uniref:Putative FAD-dependent oxidoreductase n=1 Tax=Actinoplanes missouriensis (strain ATCC 14538 / DSM 43046 / CBS 188.64 / JCM 3121 / NBRC 102363 / NCIMB 12654 / NRRL B-3342 / UNCC 431) TaxID=512565 RepID=I0HFT1_ACTM4|nr:N-methyl-L-tryptophan oxidase [Actinoplanes missouriensis]BAL91868.1 putative FAD-dependent oxidoreductase [Actinoplanes missouriensis 431]